jgi:hypothetical protein
LMITCKRLDFDFHIKTLHQDFYLSIDSSCSTRWTKNQLTRGAVVQENREQEPNNKRTRLLSTRHPLSSITTLLFITVKLVT